MQKECNKCKEIKDTSLFYPRSKEGTKTRYVCKKCDSNHALLKRKYLQEKQNTEPKYRYAKYKSGAISRKLEFSLTIDDFMNFWDKKCDYCGNEKKGIGLDRIDNTKGYLMENVKSCCFPCNKMKGSMTVENFIEKCRSISNKTISW